ncbi:DUF255 domain-containing protein [Planctomicrobium sp. SH668]|uniref:DUF255 domain-containing protein n=1 Tax=Planctomicrobium sp. SH668 TaxID=3448126 RepID=UPI003F5CADCE
MKTRLLKLMRPILTHFTLNRSLGLLLGILILFPADRVSAQLTKPKPAATPKEFGGKKNRLARESSPYLRSHADNPVNWYPWGPEAMQLALKENKPIFLSIGYSSCFWCHAMRREVFEDAEIAAYMNEHFINIKVDREERPDIDDVYMTALEVYFQLSKSSQGGGWPLSLFLTPDGRPIAGGTYFPATPKPGITAFPDVCRQIQSAWETREKDVRKTADIITREVGRLTVPRLQLKPLEIDERLVAAAVQQVAESYDSEFGGFDVQLDAVEGPKFPVPSKLALIQAQVGRPAKEGEPNYAAMLDKTLIAMASGGIWDQLGGGFHRYSTDRQWRVPHFEKMLYDNSQLAEIYVEAYRRTGREQFRVVAEEIFQFVKQDLTGPRGEFLAALDAETDGTEGAYYVWSKEELQSVLTAGEYRIFTVVYGIDGPSSIAAGYVLHRNQSLTEIADSLSLPLSELNLRLSEIRKKLLVVRSKRRPLAKDDHVLTGWNGLMIRAYARAGLVLKRPEYIQAAEKAALYLLTEHRDANGVLLRTSAELPDPQPAFLEDYAFLISGLISLYEATNEEKWLSAAGRLMEEQQTGFWDQQRGGYFFTAHNQEVVLVRLKGGSDNALPSGNSVAAQNLVRFSKFKHDDTYRKNAEKVFIAFGSQLSEEPDRAPYLALALQEYLHWYGATEIKAAGEGLFAGGITGTPPQSQQKMTPLTQPGVKKEASLLGGELQFPIQEGETVSFEPVNAQQIAARGFLSVNQIPVQGECGFAVEVVLEKDWHVNANPPKPDYVIPLRVTLTGPTGVVLKEVSYPNGSDFKVEGISDSLSVYENRVIVKGSFQTDLQTNSPVELKVSLRYQLCDHQQCLAPKNLELKATIPVAAADATPEPVNAHLFGEKQADWKARSETPTAPPFPE